MPTYSLIMNHVSSSFMQSAILNSTKGNCALSDAIHVSLTNFGNVRKVYFLIVYKKSLANDAKQYSNYI